MNDDLMSTEMFHKAETVSNGRQPRNNCPALMMADYNARKG